MGTHTTKTYRRSLAVVLILITTLLINSLQTVPVGAGPLFKPAAPDLEVIIEDPIISPPYNGCASSWYAYTNNRGHNAYLTLNVNDPAKSTNSAEWRPTLPQDGYYLVEAYIPYHPSFTWDCFGGLPIGSDSSQARYTIHTAFGPKLVTGNQKLISNGWLSLGEHFFYTGIGGYVTLTDLNDEASLSRAVSFSAIRFTWVKPPPLITFLPVAQENSGPTVNLSTIYVADASGNHKSAFIPGETIRYYVTGTNSTGGAPAANLTWSQNGPCGSSTIFKGNLTITSDNWLQYQTAPVPGCTGLYTYTVQLIYRETTSSLSIPFLVNNPGQVVVSQVPAFDKCNIPSLGQLQAWWVSSPYRSINLYIGGISRGCANTALNAFWVASASQQGWTFIPTWVGPQAPCSSLKYKFSADANIAYTQGRSEADAAARAVSNLGLEGSTVIYYDMEYFRQDIPSCRNAVKSFVNGWVGQLHERGIWAGIYGITSSILDWTDLNQVPDDIWIASWYTPYQYDPNATVWGITGLPDSLWAKHQRIRQYNGTHTETWGGVAFTIDSNVTDGPTAFLPQGAALAQSLELPPSLPSTTAEIESMQLLSSGQGWALVDQRLLWTDNGGLDWKDITPPKAASDQILGGYFLDQRQGWLVKRSPEFGEIQILKSSSDQNLWQESTLPVSMSSWLPPIQDISIRFLDANHGWMVLNYGTNGNFSTGRLYTTPDGGNSWKELALPTGGQVSFVNARRGWLSGGVGGNELYLTDDGGNTWQRQQLVPPAEDIPGQLFAGLPVFVNQNQGLLAITIADPSQPRVDIYSTSDGGSSWILTSTIPLDKQSIPTGPVNLVQNGDAGWVFPLPGSTHLYEISWDGKRTQETSPAGYPAGVSQLAFTPGMAWAQAQNGFCSGYKARSGETIPPKLSVFQCQQQSQLFRSIDGGSNWVEITPIP